MKAIIFDMDGTLCNERDFVMSGFKAVSKFISIKYAIDFNDIFNILEKDFDQGLRGKNFDVLIKKLNLKDEDINKLIKIYREHIPDVTLYKDAREILSELKGKFKLGLITDGWVKTQENKISVLGLKQYIDIITITDKYGIKCRKPYKKPFIRTLNRLRVSPTEAMYIGDNPRKDFITPKKLGMKTVRVRRGEGEYDSIDLDEEHKADITIINLYELRGIIDK